MSLRRRLNQYLRDCRSLPADAALAYRNEGVPGVWDTIAPRTVHRVVRSGRLIVFAQSLELIPDVVPPEGVTLSAVGSDHLDALASLVTQRQLDSFRELVAAGRQCLVAWRGDRPIGYGWVGARVGPDITLVPLALPPNAAYLWDLYVLPAERRKGIGSALTTARCRMARDLGYSEAWRLIAPSSEASLPTLPGSGPGTRIVGEIRFLKLISRLYTRFIPASAAPAGIP